MYLKGQWVTYTYFKQNTGVELCTVCVSGTRDPLFIQELKNRGFVLSDNITKKVKVLIVKNSNEETTKVKKATSVGITILTLEDFKQKYF